MNHVYLIQDKSYEPVGAAYEREIAHEMCLNGDAGAFSYRMIPFFKCPDTTINVIAGPIPKEYLK